MAKQQSIFHHEFIEHLAYSVINHIKSEQYNTFEQKRYGFVNTPNFGGTRQPFREWRRVKFKVRQRNVLSLSAMRAV